MTDMEQLIAEGIRAIRRVVIGVVGATVVAVGVALLVLPGPAFVVLPIGLGILAIEFEWARRLMRRARRLYETAARTSRPPDLDENGATDAGREARDPRDSHDSKQSRPTTLGR